MFLEWNVSATLTGFRMRKAVRFEFLVAIEGEVSRYDVSQPLRLMKKLRKSEHNVYKLARRPQRINHLADLFSIQWV